MRVDSPSALFVFDFDGTVIDSNDEETVNPVFPALIDQLRHAGAVWAINTGRTLFETFEGVQRLGHDYVPDFLMVKERELYCPGPYRHRWLDFGDWNDRCRHEHKRFLSKHKRVFKRAASVVAKMPEARFIDNQDEPPGIVARDDEQMDEICALIDQEKTKNEFLAYQRNGIYLRFSHIDYDKGSVMAELQRLLGVDRSSTLAAGDNHNDISMLDPNVARYMVCPGNALDVVKDHVRSHDGYVSEQPTARGLAEGIGHFAEDLFRG